MQTSQQRGARLISAAGRGDLDAVKKYIENDGSLLRTQDDDSGLFPGWTSLHWAARNGHMEVARCLLDEADRIGGASLVSLTDQDGDTSMHVAVSWGQADMVLLLLDRGGSLTTKNQAGKTPLDLASPSFRAYLQAMAGLSSHTGISREREPITESREPGARRKLTS